MRGPVHVPTWDAFEEPKFGNFNAASEVWFDGVPIPTSFVDSSELRAFVPDYMLQIAGTAVVTVYTPANGSVYLEKKWSDPDGDGVFDAPVLAEIAIKDEVSALRAAAGQLVVLLPETP